MTHASLRLEHLHCGGCGAVVSIPEGDVARCAYCGASTPVPGPYRTLRATLFSGDEDREATEALYRRLGNTPGPLLRAWSGASSGLLSSLGSGLVVWLSALGSMLEGSSAASASGGSEVLLALFFFVLALPALVLTVLGVVVAWLGRALATVLHRAPLGPIDPRSMMLGLGVAFIVLVLIPSVVLQRAVKQGELKRRVQGTLAARAPERDGGPSCCRTCGAPLLVARGALGVRCAYCSSDNLVALEPSWVAHVRSYAQRSFRTIDAFLDEENRLRDEAHERLFGTVFRIIAVLPFLLLVGAGLRAAHFSF